MYAMLLQIFKALQTEILSTVTSDFPKEINFLKLFKVVISGKYKNLNKITKI